MNVMDEHRVVPGSSASPFHAYSLENEYDLTTRYPEGRWEKCRCKITLDDEDGDD